MLLTRFLYADGVAELSDFMPVEDAGQAHNLVRRAKTVRGEVRFRMRCDPRFDYARATHTVERRSDTEVLFLGRSGDGELVLRLRSSVPMRLDNGAAVAEFTLGADESASFVLEVVLRTGAVALGPAGLRERRLQADGELLAPLGRPQHLPRPLARDGEPLGADAEAPHLAASTARSSPRPRSGSPRTIGGERNWDYRYTWIRDSSFTLYGLMRLGYTRARRTPSCAG